MGRTREFDETEALEAAMLVFWQRGFEGTSLPMLLEAMELSKSSFYHAFKSKEALFQRSLDRYADAVVESMERALEEAPSALEFIRGTLLSVGAEPSAPTRQRGCLVMNTAGEFGQRQADLAKSISRQTTRFENVFYRALNRAASEGDWSGSGSARAVARYLICALTGLKTMAKAGASRSALRETAHIALLALR